METVDLSQIPEPTIIYLRRYGDDAYDASLYVLPQARGGRMAVWPARQTIGPPDPDTDDTLSTVNWMDLSGGIGVRVINPSSDLNRSAWSTADTRYTDGWTQRPETISAAPASYSGDCKWFFMLGTNLYGVWGTAVHPYNVDDDTWGAGTSLGAVTIHSRPVVWNDAAYFPLGSDGYTYVFEDSPGVLDTPVNVPGVDTPTDNDPLPETAPKPLLFGIYNQNLYAITTKDQRYTLALNADRNGDDRAGATEWFWPWQTNRNTFVKVHKTVTPKKLVNYINRDGERALWLITDNGGLRYNEGDIVWEETNLWDVPPHPGFGRDAMVFGPGEDLWIASGGGDVVQYTNSDVKQFGQGPGGTGEGMPADRRGDVIAFAADVANMWTLIEGDTSLDSEISIVEDSPGSDSLYVPDSQSISSLLAYNRKGWHPLWESDGPAGTPTDVYVSKARNSDNIPHYRVFWSVGELAYSMPARLNLYSARQGRQRGIDRFATRSYIELGEFNGGSISKQKLSSHIEILMYHGSVDSVTGAPIEYIEFQYQTNKDDPDTWHSLGEAWNPDEHTILPFGLSEDNLWSRGLSYHWIKGRVEFWSPGGLTTPAVRSISMPFFTTPMDAANLVFTVPLPVGSCPHTFKSREDIENMLYDYIQPASNEPEFLELRYNHRVLRAYVSGVSETIMTAPDVQGALTLNLIQVKTRDGFTLGNE